ncbi:MAG: hypothetical protein AAB320_01940 [Elusimicrobiota bacterium]
MKSKRTPSRLKIALALTALCLSSQAVAAETSLGEAFGSVQETVQAGKTRLKATRAAPVIIAERGVYKASLTTLLAKQKCSSQFEQVNGREPLATCAVDAGAPGMIKPVAILPFGLHGEFDSEIGAGSKVGCTGGIRADAGLAGQFQIFVGLSPYSLDYSKEQFQQCFESVISKLQAKDRVMYFEAVQTAK